MNDRSTLLELWGDAAHHGSLSAFVLRQRWFSGRGRDLVSLDPTDAARLVDDEGLSVDLLLVTASYRDGGVEEYCVPVTTRPLHVAAVHEHGDPRLVEIAERDGIQQASYDALADPDAIERLWSLLRAGAVVRGAHGSVHFTDLGLLPDDPGGTPAHPLGRDQSNSGIVRGSRELLKVLRRLQRGSNPELEMTMALGRAGFAAIAAPTATIEHVDAGGVPALLGMVQPFLHNGTDGWALALTSLRVHYADAEQEKRPPEAAREAAEFQGATFTPEAGRIGELTASMHLAMLDDSLPAELHAQPVGGERLSAWADEFIAELDRTLSRAGAEVDALRAHRDQVVSRYDALRELGDGGTAIRVHGDYHLGQILRTDSGWTVLDFEGEPERPLADRRRPTSGLVDVAGMLRSFDYAAAVALAERVAPTAPEWDSLVAQGDAWSAANRDAFWEAYLSRASGTALLATDLHSTLVLRRALELRKAVYEVGYELGHRPAWVGIPLRFLLSA